MVVGNPPFKETPIYSSDSQESWEISSSDPFLPKHLTLVYIYIWLFPKIGETPKMGGETNG